MIRFYKCTAAFLLLFLFNNNVINAQLSETAIKDLRKSTVRVKSGSKISTGFLWKNNDWIITTLHSVEDSNNIQITFVDQVRKAKVVRVLKRYDLALLELDKPVKLPKFSSSVKKPKINTNLYVLGYNGKGNLSTVIDRSLRLGYNSSGKLKGLLSSGLRKDLAICKSPDPEIDILYFDGSLLPGFSGSPIVNNSGQLVGIADGGLEEGAQSISWGVGAKFLNDLSVSQEHFKNAYCASKSSSVKFAAENLQDDTIDYLAFNGYKFIKTKTRTIAEMYPTVDDPKGLDELITGFSMSNNLNYSDFSYDIYTDFKTGATFCVPKGTKLKVRNDLLVGHVPASNLAYLVWSKSSFSQVEHQNASLTFENKIIAYTNMDLTYEVDTDYSYSQPVFKRNGIIVNRLAYMGYYVDDYNDVYPQTYLYETHIANGNTYLGMAVINLNNTLETISLLTTCAFTGQCIGSSFYDDCNTSCINYISFSQLVLGVHMGGFSNVIH